jgi:PDZ domain-containing secreted protein
MQQHTRLTTVYKIIIYSLVGIFYCFNQLSCSKNVKEKEDIELVIKIEEDLNKPVSFAMITVDKIEKSVIGKYFWKYRRILELQTDEMGSAKITIDGKSRYRIKISYQNQDKWFCSEEFESSEINYDEELYVLRCKTAHSMYKSK